MIAITTSSPAARSLAAASGATTIEMPSLAPGDGAWEFAKPLEEWRVAVSSGAPQPRIIVAPWTDSPRAGALVDDDLHSWVARFELPFAMWAVALGAASRLCADGGAIVAVVEKPAPLDAAGWAPETGVADAVEALVRSLARSEGGRGVRANVVTTPSRLTIPPVVAPAPSLATFPGTVEVEVAGVVRLLLGPDASGLTGVVVNADCGRSWR